MRNATRDLPYLIHGLLREVGADLGPREHDLLHGAVVTHDLGGMEKMKILAGLALNLAMHEQLMFDNIH